MYRIIFISYFICILLVVGCAANSPRHFDKKLSQLNIKGIVIATVTSENRLDKSDKLQPGKFWIRKNGKEEGYTLIGGNHFRLLTENKELWLIVLEVDKGDHFISTIGGVVIGDFFCPVFKVPVLRNFKVNENEILYS